MTVLRRVRTVALLGLLAPGLAGCGGDAEERAAVEDVEQQAVDAVDGVLHDVAEQTGADFVSGNRFFSTCGEAYARRGVVLRSNLRLDAPRELTSEDAADLAATVLEGDGWRVGRSGGAVVEAGKGELRLTIEVGALTAVRITTECVETSEELAEERAGRDDVEVRWR